MGFLLYMLPEGSMNSGYTIRGAISVKENSKEAIVSATKELFSSIIENNHLQQDDIESILFSATKDLTKAYPAIAIREMGYTELTMMCFQEMDVENSLPMCIRMFLMTKKSINERKHVYLHDAKQLRPDWVEEVQNGNN
jgi:chorismate mutase